MNPSFIRQFNTSRIFHAVRLQPFMTQREISERTGADKSTVSAVIRDLEAGGLIERTRQNGDGPGRPSERIAISAKGGLLIGVHARPKEIQLVAAALDGNPLGTLSRPMPKQPDELPEAVWSSIRELTGTIGRNTSSIRAVGVTISGLVATSGDLAQSPNLGWRDVSLRELLGRTIRVPLYIGNDSNSDAIAEQMFGHGSEGGDFLYIESGSGVGGGLVLDGSLYRGAVGYSGEVGHTKIVLNGRQCRCGGRGCLSAYLADAAVIRHMQEAGATVSSPDQILEQAALGDPIVCAALRDVGTYLGAGLSNLINLLNPPLIVIGGTLARFAPYTETSMREALNQMCLPSTLRACDIRVSSVNLDPIPRGAIALALEGCTRLSASEEAPW